MLKHINNDHRNEKKDVEFDIKITKTFKTPMSRIIDEGIRIKNRDRTTLLNSKSEHYGPSVKRKVLENMVECDYCKYKGRSEFGLKKHMKLVHTNKSLVVISVK